MNTFFVKNSHLHNGIAKVVGDDFHHIKNVLRIKIGEEVYICDEDENKFIAQLAEIRDDMAVFNILCKAERISELPINITLYQGMPKSDKLEQIIKESTQLGVFEIIPVNMEHSVVKLDNTSIDKKLERWQKIALEASKQSGRQKIPSISRVINFENIIENIGKYDIVLLLYVLENSFTLKVAISCA